MTATAEIHLAALRANIATLAALAPSAASCAVVKANAYGHGLLEIATAALEAGATWLAVATPAEAAELHRSGVVGTHPVLLLSQPDASALRDAWADLPAGVRFTVGSEDGLDGLARHPLTDAPVPVHLKVDTGMHRDGVSPESAVELGRAIVDHPDAELEGVWSHFAVADEPDNDFTAEQVRRFIHVEQQLRAAGIEAPMRHLCNSAGAIAHPEAHGDLLRLGIAMYGVAPSAALDGTVALEPVMRLTATVTSIRTIDAGETVSYGRRFVADRPTRVATIDIGYADGVRRSCAVAGVDVLLRGHRAAVLGVVTMDQTMVAARPEVEVGDEAVLLGVQGDEEIRAEEVAERLGTIGYEVLTDIGPRVRRVVVDG